MFGLPPEAWTALGGSSILVLSLFWFLTYRQSLTYLKAKDERHEAEMERWQKGQLDDSKKWRDSLALQAQALSRVADGMGDVASQNKKILTIVSAEAAGIDRDQARQLVTDLLST